jgi:hypothetical protein
MSKRLQVVMSDKELVTFERAARGLGLTLSEWVRRTLREGLRAGPKRSVDRKLTAIRTAARHAFPAPDIDQMLAEIDRGRGGLPG